MSITVTQSWENTFAEKSATPYFRGVKFIQPATYDVIVDENVTTKEAEILALNHQDIPNIYDLHEYNPWAFVRSVRAVPNGGPKVFIVTVIYDALESPLDQEPEITFTSTSSNEPIDEDIYGEPITNSAGELPVNPITDDFHDGVIRIRYNTDLNGYDSFIADQYRGMLNSDVFMGRAPGKCKLTTLDGMLRKTGPYWFYEVSAEIRVRNQGWPKRFEDKGTRELLGTKVVADENGVERTVPDYRTITEKMENEIGEVTEIAVTEPVGLDGNGKRLPKGAVAVYLEYESKIQLPFANLGLRLA